MQKDETYNYYIILEVYQTMKHTSRNHKNSVPRHQTELTITEKNLSSEPTSNNNTKNTTTKKETRHLWYQTKKQKMTKSIKSISFTN